jgi:DNA repair exonuclease SbcCD ATPase subunit
MSRISRLVVPSVLALAIAGLALAQDPPPRNAGQGQQQQQMQQQRRAWMEQVQERNKRLDDLVAKMNAAKGEAKVDAIAAVINEMTEQRRALQQHPGMPMGGGPMGGPMMPAPQGGAK